MNKVHAKRSRIYMMILALVLVLVSGKTPVFAETVEVDNFTDLKAEVAKGGEIKLTKDIVVTETLMVDKDVKILGEGHTLTLPDGFTHDQMFKVDGKNEFTLDKITLDGNKQGRLIYSEGGILDISNSTIQKGCPGANAKANPGGGVFLRGGSLTATKTDFIGNTPGTTQGLDEGDRDLNGGAIYSGKTSADIKITGGSFEDNEVKAYGHGAAIYQENGSLTVTGTSFKNNKGHAEGGNAGTQGACIHTRDKVTAKISNVEAEISKGFNTGGFLRSLGSDVTVTNSKFKISGLGDGYGYSGGALCFQNGKSKVTGSTFTCTGSKLYHAGGFIDIVGGGTHVIDGNTMTGAGNDNNSAIASFGGAISVEQGAKATVTIKGNTITNSTASDNGGAIAIGTYRDGKTPKPKPGEDPVPEKTPSEVTMIGNKINNSGLIMWKGGAGGGVFAGPGATVTMSGDEIKDTKAPYGGGVYNEGDLNISGGASLTGGIALSLGGEIYNNGDLTVDNATITGNFVGPANWNQTPGHEKKYEHGGTNIYAAKDVTITPKANIATGKDVRVLDGQSKILLTGPLTKEIDVSISEIAGGNETAKRKVGYVVAEGTKSYSAKKSDANFLHYIGRTNKEDDNHYSNQPRAAYGDDKSTGEWDFVLDKDNKKVVLGQRVKLIYHGNLGTIGSADKEEKTVDVYKSPNFWEGQLEEYQVADPTLDGSSFMGWYFWKDGDSVEDTDDSIQNIKLPDDFTNDLFDFSKVTFQNNVKDTDQIITPNIIHTYAGWSDNISIPVLKDWGDTEEADKTDVTVTLKGGEKDITLTLKKTDNYFDQFEDLKVFTKSYKGEEKNMNLRFESKTYSVEETPIDGFTTSYSPQSMKANEVAEVSRFVVTNTKQKYKVSYKFESATEDKTLPKEVTDLLPTDSKEYEDNTTVIPATLTTKEVKVTGGKWTFKEWTPATATINKANVEFVGKWEFEADPPAPAEKYKVSYKFESATEDKTLPKEVTDLLPTDSKEYEDNTTVTPVTLTTKEVKVTGGKWTFKEWTPATATINKANVEFVGKWEFEADNPDEPNPPKEKIITRYVDGNDMDLISPRDGKHDKETIRGYEFVETKETTEKTTDGSKTIIRHIYKKVPEDNRNTGGFIVWKNEPVSDDGLLNKKDHKAYMFGYPDGNFLPDRNMTREEVTAMFARLLKDYPRERRSYAIPYKDVTERDWSYEAIGFMTEKGIIKGYEDGSFRPKEAISRAEFAAMAARFDKLVAGTGNPFNDVPDTHWAVASIDSAAAKGWVSGYPDGSFKPERKITRSEVVSITNIMLDRYADKDFVRGHLPEMIPFYDLTEANWAYFPIMEATHGHDYTRKAPQEENWIRLNGEEFRFPLLYRK